MTLDEIRKLCEAATPGPWEADDKGVHGAGKYGIEVASTKWSDRPCQNAEFISAARELLLPIAEENARLRAAVEAARAAMPPPLPPGAIEPHFAAIVPADVNAFHAAVAALVMKP